TCHEERKRVITAEGHPDSGVFRQPPACLLDRRYHLRNETVTMRKVVPGVVTTHPPASRAAPLPHLDAVAVAARFGRREAALDRLAADAAAVARTAQAIAGRFHRGGTLFVFGNGTAATDAAHVAVEFVHPAIVGKRALPAVALDADVATLTGVAGRAGFGEVFAHQLDLLAGPDDIALGISPHGNCVNVLRALETGHARGLLTVAMVGGDGGAIATSPVVAHL